MVFPPGFEPGVISMGSIMVLRVTTPLLLIKKVKKCLDKMSYFTATEFYCKVKRTILFGANKHRLRKVPQTDSCSSSNLNGILLVFP